MRYGSRWLHQGRMVALEAPTKGGLVGSSPAGRAGKRTGRGGPGPSTLRPGARTGRRERFSRPVRSGAVALTLAAGEPRTQFATALKPGLRGEAVGFLYTFLSLRPGRGSMYLLSRRFYFWVRFLLAKPLGGLTDFSSAIRGVLSCGAGDHSGQSGAAASPSCWGGMSLRWFIPRRRSERC